MESKLILLCADREISASRMRVVKTRHRTSPSLVLHPRKQTEQPNALASLSPESPTRRYGRPKARTKPKNSQCVEAPFAPMSVMLNVFLVPMHLYKVFFVCKFRGGSCSFLSSFEVYLSSLGVFFCQCLFRVQVQGHLVFFWRKHARQVELDVLVHEEGHAGRWQDPNEVWSKSVISHMSVQPQFKPTAITYPL